MSDEGFKEVMEEILFGDNPTQAFDNALKKCFVICRRKKNKNFVSGQEKTILRICKVGKFIIQFVGMNG